MSPLLIQEIVVRKSPLGPRRYLLRYSHLQAVNVSIGYSGVARSFSIWVKYKSERRCCDAR